MRLSPASGLLALSLTLGLAVSSCSAETVVGGGLQPIDWSTGEPVDPSGLVYAVGPQIHLADGTVLDAGAPISAFVVAGDGAWVVASQDGGPDPLLHVTEAGAVDTGAHVDFGELAASPDGRYLAFVESEAGRRDGYGTPRLQSVAVDLERGVEVLRSEQDMGDLDDDLAHLYENVSAGVLGVDDTTAWFDTAVGDVLALDLASGEVGSVADTTDGPEPWQAPRHADDAGFSELWNADRTWWIDVTPRYADPDLLADASDRPLPLTGVAGAVSLERWLDVDTALGIAIDGFTEYGSPSQDGTRTLVTCEVPSGVCAPVASDADGGRLLLPAPSLS